jgi:hypothetical protein
MAVDFVSYVGDKNLGLGSNPDIPAISEKPGLDVINDTGKTIMMLNHENNKKIFDQKVKDRDEQLKLLDSGQVQTGEILDKDRPEIKKYQEAANTKFYDFVKKGGVNNPEAYREYQNSIRELKDAVTHAQFRFVGRKQLEKEKADQPLKYKQGLYDNHLANEDKKGFYDGTYSPFQVSTDYDADAIPSRGLRDAFSGDNTAPQATGTTNKVITKTKDGKTSVTDVQTTAPTKGGKVQQSVDKIVYKDGLPYTVSEQRVDFEKIRQNQIQDFMEEGKFSENQTKHLEAYDTAPDSEFEPVMNRIVDRVSDYNKDLGLQPGDKGYIDPTELAKKLGIDPLTKKRTGQKIMLSTPDFAAFTALAAHNGSYAPKQMTLLKDEAGLKIKMDESKAKINAMKALANERNAKANLTGKKGKILDKQFNPIQTFGELGMGKIGVAETGNGTKITRINASGMSKAFLDNLGIDPINNKGDYNVFPSNIKYNGKDLPQDVALDLYNKWLTTPDAKKLQDSMKKEPDVFDFLYSMGATFPLEGIEVIGKVKPVYKLNKEGERVLMNPNEAGKVTRSNKLQSWINQRSQMGVKGDKLLMEEPGGEDGNSDTE